MGYEKAKEDMHSSDCNALELALGTLLINVTNNGKKLGRNTKDKKT